jgi:hypothetical protein
MNWLRVGLLISLLLCLGACTTHYVHDSHGTIIRSHSYPLDCCH